MTLLQSTLELLRNRLDAAFQVADPRSEGWVALTNPVDLDGRILLGRRAHDPGAGRWDLPG